MKLNLHRINDNGKSTIGVLSIGDEFECFTLEDTFNEPKIYGETRIPSGDYEIKLRKGSPMANRYDEMYSNHNGMLWLQNVENFKWVYIHVGNDMDDTDGCVLVGRNCHTTSDTQTISGSALAYTRLYEKVYKAIQKGETVSIRVS